MRDAEATKASILDAAEEEFGRFGLQGARTESIAAQTGVTKAMIHYYYDSKERLYCEVLRRLVERRTRRMDGLNLHSFEPMDALKLFFSDLLGELHNRPTTPSILLFEALQNRGRFYREISAASLYGPLIETLERGVACGQFRVDLEPRHTAINLMGMVVFYICTRDNLSSLWSMDADLMDSEHYRAHVDECVTMACNSVRRL